MGKHTAKIVCVFIVLVLVADIAGQTPTVTTPENNETTVEGTEDASTVATGGTTLKLTEGTTRGVKTDAAATTGVKTDGSENATTPTLGGPTLKLTEGTTRGTKTDAAASTGVKTDVAASTKADTTTAPDAVTDGKTLRVFEGKLKILKAGGNEAEFTEEFNDPESNQFKSGTITVCLALIIASNESSSATVKECKVTSFMNGSIVAAFSLTYDEANFTATQLKEFLVKSFNSSDNYYIKYLTVDLVSITVEEKTETKPTKKSNVTGLSTAAIAGIIAGSVGGVLLIVVLVVVIIKCKGSSAKVDISDNTELIPPAKQDAEAGRYRKISSSDKQSSPAAKQDA